MSNKISPKLDGKFGGVIYKLKNGLLVPEDMWVCFLVKDNIFATKMLPFYRDECKRQGADEEQLAAADRLIDRADQWRARYPGLCKVPDAAGEKMGG